MKPVCIGAFTIPSVNYNPNNYYLDLCRDPRLNLIYTTWYISKIKTRMNNNSI